jgi:amidase
MPDVTQVRDAWWDLACAEAAAFHADNYPSRSDEYGPGFRDVLAHGVAVTGTAYADAAKLRAELAGRVNRLLATVDCMVCPSLPSAAFPIGTDGRRLTPATEALGLGSAAYTKTFNFSGSPTLSVPCGFSDDGLPLSVQFVGQALSESMLCRVGHAFEQSSEWSTRHPQL